MNCSAIPLDRSMDNLPGNLFRRKALVAFGFLVLIGFYLPDYPEVWGADWKFLTEDDEGIWSYNSGDIECPSDSLLRIRAKKFYDGKGVLLAAEKYGKDYRDLDHVLCCWEIDCPRRKFRLISATFYTKDNSIIQGYDDEKEGYFTPEDIPADSYLELLYKKACK